MAGPSSLTLRTSIIGRELHTSSGLVEWFLNNRGGHVRGFSRAIYSGFTTQALARIIADLIERFPALNGLYQVSSEPINKYDLLCLIRHSFDLPVEIEQYADFELDRSLDSSRFRAATGFIPPGWPSMIEEMASDQSQYAQWRKNNGI